MAMTVQSWLMYLILVVIATSTPGPAVLFITTKSLLHGWRKSVFAALGNIAGLLLLGVIAVTGLGAILKTSEGLFTFIRYAGAAYLVFLGIKLFCQKNINVETPQNLSPAAIISSKKLFLQALGIAVSNPKAIVFLTALLPQFMVIDRPIAMQFVLLISVLMLFSFSFLMLYSVLASQARAWFTRPGRARAVNRTSGSIFVGFGILLAVSSES
jgi:threonine/homoserine/homoserine lactone efflux protein